MKNVLQIVGFLLLGALLSYLLIEMNVPNAADFSSGVELLRLLFATVIVAVGVFILTPSKPIGDGLSISLYSTAKRCLWVLCAFVGAVVVQLF